MSSSAPTSTSYEADVHSSDDKSPDLEKVQTSDFPDGGAKAWLVAAGAAVGMFSTMGFVNSFGIFQSYYKTNQLPHETNDNIAWIGSIQAWLMFCTGIVAGPLTDRYGPWVSPTLPVYKKLTC